MKIVLAAINAKYIHANLAIYSLRAFSDEYKEQIQIKEYTINQYTEDILADLYKEQADMVAFSCYIWNMGMVEELAELLHQLRPEMPIWFGGPEVSYDAAECLQRNHGVTGILRGEGEESFHELMQYYIGGSGKFQDIRGIIYREDGLLVDNGWREVMNLNKVPFVYEEMEDFKNKIIYYETSRGCPFSCSYCLSSVDKKVRLRDMSLVEKELQFFINHEVPQVKFVDRTFNCNKKHAMAIWRYIKAHDKGITNFHFEIGADLLDDEELEILSDMRPGLIQLEIGVQSTNDATIQEVSRTMRLDRLARAVDRVNAGHNIHQHLDLIAGLPYEDYHRFKQSFNDVYRMRPEQLQLGFLKVLKGSRMHVMAEQYGIVYRRKAPYEVLKTDWMSYVDILKLKGVEEMVEVYYNSHQFDLSVTYLMHFYQEPFDFFEDLAEFYEATGFGKVQHGRMQRYDILLRFVQQRHLGAESRVYLCQECETAVAVQAESGAENSKLNKLAARESEVSEILKFTMLYDLYARENLKSRPEWAQEILYRPFCEDFYRDETLTRQYLPSYSGCTSRQMKRMTHMEGFVMDIAETAKAGYRIGGPEALLFDYKERDPLTYAAKIVKVSIKS